MAMRFETVKSSVTLSTENQRTEKRGIIWMAFISREVYISDYLNRNLIPSLPMKVRDCVKARSTGTVAFKTEIDGYKNKKKAVDIY